MVCSVTDPPCGQWGCPHVRLNNTFLQSNSLHKLEPGKRAGNCPIPRHRSTWTSSFDSSTHEAGIPRTLSAPLTDTKTGQPDKFPPGQLPWVTTFCHLHENKALAMFWIGVKTHPTHGVYSKSSQRPLSNFKNKLSFKRVIKANDPSMNPQLLLRV